MTEPLLAVENLCVDFATRSGPVRVLNDVSFTLAPGETLGIVGESGCGKSMTSLAVMGLVPRPNGRIASGRILFRGEDLVRAPARRMRQIRGAAISMIFQEPMTSLNPIFTVGRQIAEAIRLHEDVSRAEVRNRVVDVLGRVGIPDPTRRADEYPHQLSGGMRQRVMIAMALVCRPQILIADEPTTALDVTVQAQILDLILGLQQEENTAVILISHDMGVISQVSDRIMVMYAGRAIEKGPCREVVETSAHPYTRGLIACIPDIERTGRMTEADRLPTIPGIVPDLRTLGETCAFAPRCALADAGCDTWTVAPVRLDEAHVAACRKAAGGAVA